MKLSEEQEIIAETIDEGQNVFITGAAGTGKSFLIRHLITKHAKQIDVTASTGIAAVNIGGITLHSWAGLGLGDKSADEIIDGILLKKGRAYKSILACQKLIIDEISMIDGKLLDKINIIFKEIRGTNLAFGGIQMILSGDFFQLPPVTRSNEERQFAFECSSWENANINICEMQKVFRQSDESFIHLLGNLRKGLCTDESIKILTQVKDTNILLATIKPTRLFSHNADADQTNLSELKKLEGQEYIYLAEDTGEKVFIEMLRKNCIAPEELRLKKGSQVMLLHNLSQAEGIVNGSIGIVENFIDGMPFVKFHNGKSKLISRHTWEINSKEDELATRLQIPLRLAWAITIHKSQGMTLDKVECDLTKVFEYGQAYVALSRAKSLEGLFVKGLNKRSVKAHPRVKSFFEALQ
ncbi:MAG: DEAD/DEAH box helicase [Candidatus Melainabacteria bacterium]|jgi:ATP-dependent DNA helicase PIF1